MATALARTKGEGINAYKMVLKKGEKEGRVDGQKPEKYRGRKPFRNSRRRDDATYIAIREDIESEKLYIYVDKDRSDRT